jgi:hypothetical protein
MPRRTSCTAKACFSGDAREAATNATIPIPSSQATIKKNSTRYSVGVGFRKGPVTIKQTLMIVMRWRPHCFCAFDFRIKTKLSMHPMLCSRAFIDLVISDLPAVPNGVASGRGPSICKHNASLVSAPGRSFSENLLTLKSPPSSVPQSCRCGSPSRSFQNPDLQLRNGRAGSESPQRRCKQSRDETDTYVETHAVIPRDRTLPNSVCEECGA